MKCGNCGKILQSKKKFCSDICIDEYVQKNTKQTIERCSVCNKKFSPMKVKGAGSYVYGVKKTEPSVMEFCPKCNKSVVEFIKQRGHYFKSDSSTKKGKNNDLGNISKNERIKADVDDSIYAVMKAIQKKYKLTWNKARDTVNSAIMEMYYIL